MPYVVVRPVANKILPDKRKYFSGRICCTVKDLIRWPRFPMSDRGKWSDQGIVKDRRARVFRLIPESTERLSHTVPFFVEPALNVGIRQSIRSRLRPQLFDPHMQDCSTARIGLPTAREYFVWKVCSDRLQIYVRSVVRSRDDVMLLICTKAAGIIHCMNSRQTLIAIVGVLVLASAIGGVWFSYRSSSPSSSIQLNSIDSITDNTADHVTSNNTAPQPQPLMQQDFIIPTTSGTVSNVVTTNDATTTAICIQPVFT